MHYVLLFVLFPTHVVAAILSNTTTTKSLNKLQNDYKESLNKVNKLLTQVKLEMHTIKKTKTDMNAMKKANFSLIISCKCTEGELEAKEVNNRADARNDLNLQLAKDKIFKKEDTRKTALSKKTMQDLRVKEMKELIDEAKLNETVNNVKEQLLRMSQHRLKTETNHKPNESKGQQVTPDKGMVRELENPVEAGKNQTIDAGKEQGAKVFVEQHNQTTSSVKAMVDNVENKTSDLTEANTVAPSFDYDTNAQVNLDNETTPELDLYGDSDIDKTTTIATFTYGNWTRYPITEAETETETTTESLGTASTKYPWLGIPPGHYVTTPPNDPIYYWTRQKQFATPASLATIPIQSALRSNNKLNPYITLPEFKTNYQYRIRRRQQDKEVQEIEFKIKDKNSAMKFETDSSEEEEEKLKMKSVLKRLVKKLKTKMALQYSRKYNKK